MTAERARFRVRASARVIVQTDGSPKPRRTQAGDETPVPLKLSASEGKTGPVAGVSAEVCVAAGPPLRDARGKPRPNKRPSLLRLEMKGRRPRSETKADGTHATGPGRSGDWGRPPVSRPCAASAPGHTEGSIYDSAGHSRLRTEHNGAPPAPTACWVRGRPALLRPGHLYAAENPRKGSAAENGEERSRTEARPVGAVARARGDQWGWPPSARGTPRPAAPPREALPPTPGDGPPSGSDMCFMVRGGRGGDVFPSCGRVTGSIVPAEAHDAKPNMDYKPKCHARVFQVKTEIETDDAGQRGAPAGVCGFSVAESPAFLSASL